MPDDQSATRRAYTAILEAILDGRHPAGTMLSEAALAAQAGLSRTPIRTALALLQDEGWVSIYPKRGAMVQGLSERDVADFADARLILESTSVRRARTEDLRQLAERLESEVAVQREALGGGDVRAFIESTIAFHRSFVQAGRNRVMLELNDRLADRQRFLLFSYGDTLLARAADIIAEHEELVAHLRAGDAEAFAEALRHHIGDTLGTPLDEIEPAQPLPRTHGA
ncbi:MAG TPA: GntR family transcriptional regulator [Solirubrobacter sp.]|nr:GntR family transcriptional regulator [Solirubrobacter sp.]